MWDVDVPGQPPLRIVKLVNMYETSGWHLWPVRARFRFILYAQPLVVPATDDELVSLELAVAPFDRESVLAGAEGDRLARRLDEDLLTVYLNISFGALDDDLDATVVGGHVEGDAQRDHGECESSGDRWPKPPRPSPLRPGDNRDHVFRIFGLLDIDQVLPLGLVSRPRGTLPGSWIRVRFELGLGRWCRDFGWFLLGVDQSELRHLGLQSLGTHTVFPEERR